jgi:hypothetical protein
LEKTEHKSSWGEKLIEKIAFYLSIWTLGPVDSWTPWLPGNTGIVFIQIKIPRHGEIHDLVE